MDMTMASAVPDWLTPVAWTYIIVSLLSAAFIAADLYVLRRRQRSVATELVWITSALYLGPFAAPAYLRRGRAHSAGETDRDGTIVAVLSGGGASAVAHLIAVPFVAAVGWTIAGMAMWPMILVIAVLAIAMVAAFVHLSGRPGQSAGMGGVSVGAALVAAVITVAAFDVGMVGWMLLLDANSLMPAVTEGTFWFLMQLGVVVGLATGYPAVRWLLRRDQAAVVA
ncbi:DUF4396 domain-containing protein [uncultured Nocardioides sp.]|uniref:DUF4396 domain-containing protein n=1 Tax=uncultured Nocardioides sp. TaxID=198441 RepID=UPI0025F7FAE9|nr:DUF4396 domain-containing protein [uncultured Nocardioides sp.]